MREDPSGEWAHNRYEAAWEFASWFRALWKDKGVERRTFETLKTFLSDIYLNGDDAIRRCIVDGALEHMFENRDITKYFESWKKDPDFAVAFKEAVSWQGKNCKDEPS